MGLLFRTFSYLYHTALAILLVGVGGLALTSHSHTLRLGMLPWTGKELNYWLLGSGVFGLFSIWFALRGKLRFLFLIYSLAVFGIMLRGYFLGTYSFHGSSEFRMAAWLTGGAFTAAIGALSQMFKKASKKRRRR